MPRSDDPVSRARLLNPSPLRARAGGLSPYARGLGSGLMIAEVLLVTSLVMVGPASAATPAGARILLKAPYTGLLTPTVSKSATTGCASFNSYLPPTFHLSNGSITASGGLSAHSCSGFPAGSSALHNAAGGALLNFSKKGGLVTITATFTVDLIVQLSMGGATCSDPNQHAKGIWAATAELINWSAGGTVTPGQTKGGGDAISSAKTTFTPFNYVHSLSWTTTVSATDLYAVAFAFSFGLTTGVSGPQKGDTDYCAASASIVPGSGTVVMTLDDIIIN
jgi:hypothetical protein